MTAPDQTTQDAAIAAAFFSRLGFADVSNADSDQNRVQELLFLLADACAALDPDDEDARDDVEEMEEALRVMADTI